jgi:shikimate kinase
MSKIVITGFMGSGKSTVASALASRLESEVVDLDQAIESETGQSASEIIEQSGEAAFRQIESGILRGVLEDSASEIGALGGGAWTLETNRRLINEHGALSVWLDAPFDHCWKRIVETGGARPLARTEAEAKTLFTQRRPAYELADVHVQINDRMSPAEIAEEIIHALANRKV